MKRALTILAVVALAGCDDSAEMAQVPEQTEPQVTEAVGPNDIRFDETLPGAQSEYAYGELLALEPDDGTLIASSTQGAGFCTFVTDGGQILLTAGAPTEEEKPGAAVVRPNGQPATALYAQGGGSEYLAQSPIFEREPVDGAIAMTIEIIRSDDSDAATLTYSVPDGERDPYNGRWNCTA